MKYQIIQGDNRETLKNIADNSIDAIVTDPPYGIDFLGKQWDVNTGELETYEECLRVLKPGGHILAFSAARTYHHLAMTLERAGFEIRDQIMWIYSSGFPKSQDVGRQIQKKLGVKETKTYKHNSPRVGGDGEFGADGTKEQIITTDPEAQKWAGWGTALKPAHEPIALARKPIKQSIAKNCQEWGTGAINIDATRVGDEPIKTVIKRSEDNSRWYKHSKEGDNIPKVIAEEINPIGRFPSNVIGEILQEDYQKYFYCPKVSRKERHMGFEDPGPMFRGSRVDIYQPNKNSPDIQITSAEKKNVPQNNHPTVKPVALMEYLIKLITPPGGTVLDPFNGSGSTGMAATGLGFNYIGLELDPNYVAITEKRIEAWLAKDEPEEETTSTFKELFEQCP